MKKIIIISVSVVILVVFAVIGVRLIGGFGSKGSNSFDKAVEVLNKSYPSSIMCYGEDMKFSESVKVTWLDTLSKQIITSDKESKFRFLVISDMSGKAKLSADECKMLKALVDKNSLNIYYIGTDKMKLMVDAGIIGGMPDKDELSVAYIYSCGKGITLRGVWTKAEEAMLSENDRLLEELLINSFVDDVIRLNV